MTSDGEQPPRLPDGDDPFEVLGVSREANEREIRRAYARRIKVYRPDRAPREFQRIQQAFELLSSGVFHDHERPPPARPSIEPAPSTISEREQPNEDQRRTVSALLVEARAAIERDDVDGARRAIGALFDLGAPLDLVFLDPDDHAMLLDSSVLSWSRLGSHDPAGRAAVWTQAFERAFAADPLRACFLLDDDALRLDAADDPALALYLLGRLAALSWRVELPLHTLLERYRAQLPSHPALDHVLDGVGLDLAASDAARRAGLPEVLEQLPALFISARSGTWEEDRTRAEDVQSALAADVPSTLTQLEQCTHGSPELYQALSDRIIHELPPHRLRLDALSARRLAHLSGELAEAGRRTWSRTALLRRGAIVLAMIALSVIIPPFAILFPLGAIMYWLITEADRYKHDVRARVARAILHVPVESHVAARWVALNRKLRGRLGRFDVGIAKDAGLHLLSIVACFAAEVGRLDEHLDEPPPSAP